MYNAAAVRIAAAAVVFCLALGSRSLLAATLAIACGSVGREMELCREGANAWARATGHEVRLISTPGSGTERLALYQQLLAAQSPDVDVLQIDVVWPGILASHLLDLSGRARELPEQFPTMLASATVGGRLVALPWFMDAGLLYYRRDLLEKHRARVPESWAELTETAGRVQAAERAAGRASLWGYVWQGRAYEGLTCNALEWVASFGGGTVVDTQGRITIDNPHAAQALALAARWVGSITPKGVLNYAEEEARGVFQSGGAVFMRNWPYAWALLEGPHSPVRGKVGVAPLPRGPGGGAAATLGGQQLAVSRYSRHPELAFALALYLTSRAEQKRRALSDAFNPTLPELYSDAELRTANPFVAQLAPVFRDAVARPSFVTGRRYNRVSAAFWISVHGVISGQDDPASALQALDRRLLRISRGGRW
jgi:trehalose/maltose transport system substrate-binding protein